MFYVYVLSGLKSFGIDDFLKEFFKKLECIKKNLWFY